jgi:hypothetical protein
VLTLINYFNIAKWNGLLVPGKFHIDRDCTFLEREILRATHAELDQSKQAGESDLIVAFINNKLSVIKPSQKYRIPGSGVSQHLI